MAIELKEYVGAVVLQTKSKGNDINLSEGYTQTYIDDQSLMVDIEAIHSIITRNDTLYTSQCIKDSVPYWTAPYERPVIMHHNEKDGKIIGRVKAANHIEKSERSGTAALELVTNIGDEEGIKGIKNGTLATVSIGAIAHDIRCSICGTNIVEEGLCEHDKGEVYEGKRCYWIVNKIEPKEVSYVIVPSDIYAHNTRVYEAVERKNKNNEVKESMSNIFADLIEAHGLNSIDTKEATEPQVTEGTQLGEEVKDGAKVGEVTGKEEPVAEPEKKDPEAEGKEPEKTEPEVEPKEEPKVEPEQEPEAEGEQTTPESKEGEDKSKELEDAKKEIVELTAKVAALTAENEKLSNQVKSEKALKEAAEAQLLGFKVEKKKSLVESVNTLRGKLNLPAQDVNALMEYTEEDLSLTIKNLSEFAEVQKQTFAGLSLIESPVAVSDDKDNTNCEKNKVTDVKESVNDSNIDFEQQLTDILSKCL